MPEYGNRNASPLHARKAPETIRDNRHDQSAHQGKGILIYKVSSTTTRCSQMSASGKSSFAIVSFKPGIMDCKLTADCSYATQLSPEGSRNKWTRFVLADSKRRIRQDGGSLHCLLKYSYSFFLQPAKNRGYLYKLIMRISADCRFIAFYIRKR